MSDPSVFRKLWAEVLGLASAHEDQNFFDCGGDSLLAVRLISRAREHGLVLRATDLFTLENLGEIQTRLVRTVDTSPLASEQGPQHALLPAQRRWVDGPLADVDHFNLGWLFYAPAKLSRPHLERAVTRVLERQEALRTAYEVDAAGVWRASVMSPNPTAVLDEVEVSDDAEMAGEIARAHTSMSLAKGRVFRVVHLRRGGKRSRLLVLAHHLTLDGFSLGLLADDLEAGLEDDDSSATTTPGEYARAIERWVLGSEAREDVDSWRRLPWSSLGTPPGASLKPALLGTIGTVTGVLTPDETRAVSQLARRAGVRLDMLLLGAATGAIAEWSGRQVQGVDVYHHGRDVTPGGVNVTRTVGYVQNTFPVLLRWGGAGREWVRDLAEQLRAVPTRPFGFDALRYAGTGELAGLPRLGLRYNFRGQFGRVNQRGNRQLQPAPESFGRHRSARQSERYALMLEGDLLEAELQFGIKFSRDHFDEEAVSGLIRRTLTHLREAIREPTSK